MDYHIFAGEQESGHDVVCLIGVFNAYIGRVMNLEKAYEKVLKKYPNGQLWAEALNLHQNKLLLIARMNTMIVPNVEVGYGAIVTNQWEFINSLITPEQMKVFKGPVQEFPDPRFD